MKISAKDRMARLIAAIPWIVAQGVFYVGVPPYTPDTLIEVTIDDDMVWISYADWFARPMRLSGAEILSLLAAGETALAFDNQDEAGALARGLTKLRLATGSDADTVDVQLANAAVSALPTLRSASTDHRCVDISYYSFARDEHTERRIEPSRFFIDGGHWYVGGYCHLADDERVFRVDRIETAQATAQPFTQSAAIPDESFAMVNAPRVTIELPASRERVLDGLPFDSRSDSAEVVTVTLPVSSARWLEQLLLRLGPGARMLEDPPIAESLDSLDLAGAAERILGRYGA